MARFAKKNLSQLDVYNTHVIDGAKREMGYIEEIEGDLYVVFDGRIDGDDYVDVWFAKDSPNGTDDYWVPIFRKDSDGIRQWVNYGNKRQVDWKKVPHDKEHLIRGYSVREAIINVMGY